MQFLYLIVLKVQSKLAKIDFGRSKLYKAPRPPKKWPINRSADDALQTAIIRPQVNEWCRGLLRCYRRHAQEEMGADTLRGSCTTWSENFSSRVNQTKIAQRRGALKPQSNKTDSSTVNAPVGLPSNLAMISDVCNNNTRVLFIPEKHCLSVSNQALTEFNRDRRWTKH